MMTRFSYRLMTARVRSAVTVLSVAFLVFLATGCGTPFKSQERLTLTAPATGNELIVDNGVGQVVVRADPDAKEVSAVVTKIGKGSSENEANKALEQIQVSLASEGGNGALRATAHQPNSSAFRNYEVNWELTAPPGLKVRVTNDVGNIHVHGIRGDVTLKNDVGTTSVTCDPAGTGVVSIENGVGDVRVSDSYSGLSATTDVGNIQASAGGSVNLRSGVGDVKLRLRATSEKGVKVSTDVGDVFIQLATNQQGRLAANTDVGSVNLNLDGLSLREFRHRGHHASAMLGDASEPMIDLSSDVGNVVIKTYRADQAEIRPAATSGSTP